MPTVPSTLKKQDKRHLRLRLFGLVVRFRSVHMDAHAHIDGKALPTVATAVKICLEPLTISMSFNVRSVDLSIVKQLIEFLI
jgi:hypothetical protein